MDGSVLSSQYQPCLKEKKNAEKYGSYILVHGTVMDLPIIVLFSS